MADNKYGRVFTQGDVEKIIEFLFDEEYLSGEIELTLMDILHDMDVKNTRWKFDADEPVFILRGRDRRAFGAIRHYQDHQARTAPINHTDSVDKAIRSFSAYREQNPEVMREPD